MIVNIQLLENKSCQYVWSAGRIPRAVAVQGALKVSVGIRTDVCNLNIETPDNWKPRQTFVEAKHPKTCFTEQKSRICVQHTDHGRLSSH